MGSDKHKKLQEVAIHWLYGINCSIFAQEVPTLNGVADALGIKIRNDWDGMTAKKVKTIYYIEAKASRSDLICFKQKSVYRRSLEDTGIDFYYLIVADGVKVEDTLYPEWGVISENGKLVRRAKRRVHNGNFDFDLTVQIAHVLVYKVFGKLYLKK